MTIENISSWLNILVEPDRRPSSGRFVWDDFDEHPWRKILTEPNDRLCAYRNIQNFLRAFYFQWKREENLIERKDLVEQQIYKALQFFETGFYNTEEGFFRVIES